MVFSPCLQFVRTVTQRNVASRLWPGSTVTLSGGELAVPRPATSAQGSQRATGAQRPGQFSRRSETKVVPQTEKICLPLLLIGRH